MDFELLKKKITDFLLGCPLNYVPEEDAIRPELAGMQIYDEPLFGVADVNDPLFEELRKEGIVGEAFDLPHKWLDNPVSVLSFFLPFTEQVKVSNRKGDVASDEWLHARIEGQQMMNKLGEYVKELLISEGFDTAFPTTDSRFHLANPYCSNWSERHVAYIAGLGTLSLSKGIITKKGMAGRLGSVITTAKLPVTMREYSSPFEYCIMCGACQKNCPVNAIDMSKGVEKGKNHEICSPFVGKKFPPNGPNNIVRYGCGKCQVGVPCESKIPGK